MIQLLNKQRQIDIALQQFGSAEYLFAVAIYNGISITDELLDRESISIPIIENTADEKAIALVLQKRLNRPASSDDDAIDFFIPPSGIGYMNIQGNFIVS